MRHRRAVVTAVVGLAASLLVGSAAGSSAPPTAAGLRTDPGTAVADVRTPTGTVPRFTPPLPVPPAPSGALAQDGGSDLLTPGTVQVPHGAAVQRLAPRAEFRPA